MTAPTEQPAPTRDEILQSHLVAIREEIHGLPARIAGWMLLLGVAAAIVYFIALSSM